MAIERRFLGSDRADTTLGIVVIGRNEGERLKVCLRSIPADCLVAYVDSGSTDGSVTFARDLGAIVEELAIPPNFTAARARNAGIAALRRAAPDLEFVQTIDGDCELRPEWLASGVAFLDENPDVAAVSGRLRERHPDRSLYNALCDYEWSGPVGDAPFFGGIALLRVAAVSAAGGYSEGMIAGEEPDLSFRMRKIGWRIARIGAEMALHDADMTRFVQWWRRAKRGGHAAAELALLHGDARWPDWVRARTSMLVWGVGIPMVALVGLLAAMVDPWAIVLTVGALALYPLKAAQIFVSKYREGLRPKLAAVVGVLFMLGKIPEALGVVRFYRDRSAGRRPEIIEHRG